MNTVETNDARSRAWHAVVLMVPLLAMLMIPTLFLIDVFVTATDGWAGLGYVVVTLMVYVAAVLVALPILAHTLSYFIDARTRHLTDLHAASIFAGTAALLGSVLAVPMTVTGDFGTLPLITFCLAPGLAAFTTRLLLPVVMRVKVARITAYVVAGVTALPFLVGVLSVIFERVSM